jgi:hypothetical protein
VHGRDSSRSNCDIKVVNYVRVVTESECKLKVEKTEVTALRGRMLQVLHLHVMGSAIACGLLPTSSCSRPQGFSCLLACGVMSWDTDKAKCLEGYRERSILWDIRDPNYKDNRKKFKL